MAAVKLSLALTEVHKLHFNLLAKVTFRLSETENIDVLDATRFMDFKDRTLELISREFHEKGELVRYIDSKL